MVTRPTRREPCGKPNRRLVRWWCAGFLVAACASNASDKLAGTYAVSSDLAAAPCGGSDASVTAPAMRIVVEHESSDPGGSGYTFALCDATTGSCSGSANELDTEVAS